MWRFGRDNIIMTKMNNPSKLCFGELEMQFGSLCILDRVRPIKTFHARAVNNTKDTSVSLVGGESFALKPTESSHNSSFSELQHQHSLFNNSVASTRVVLVTGGPI